MRPVPAFYQPFYAGANNAPKKARAKNKEPEHKFQVALVKVLREYARCRWHAIPNGGLRNIRVATKLKAEGVTRGVADLHFVLPPTGRSAFLELKAPKGRLSPEQKQFRDDVLRDGGLWEHAKSFDEAYGILAGWGVLPSSAERKSA